MPKSAKHSAIARQWQMLKLVPQRSPGITVRDLVLRLADEGYTVSRRTVERDLNDLSRVFGLTTSEDPSSHVQRWYFAVGKVPDLGSVDLVDAVSLALAGDVLEQLLPGVMLDAVSGKIGKARIKLKSLTNLPLARWTGKVRYIAPTVTFIPPAIPRRIMQVVQNALMEERQLEVSYEAFQQKPRPLRLHPFSLVLRGNVPYLLATVFEYSEVRIFAIHRMRKAVVLADKAVIPPDFAVDEYLAGGSMEFGAGKAITLKAQLSDDLAFYLSETPLSPDQKIRYRNSSWQLTATVRDTWQLQFWLISQAGSVTVGKPLSLRRRITAQLQQAIGQYQVEQDA